MGNGVVQYESMFDNEFHVTIKHDNSIYSILPTTYSTHSRVATPYHPSSRICNVARHVQWCAGGVRNANLYFGALFSRFALPCPLLVSVFGVWCSPFATLCHDGHLPQARTEGVAHHSVSSKVSHRATFCRCHPRLRSGVRAIRHRFVGIATKAVP